MEEVQDIENVNPDVQKQEVVSDDEMHLEVAIQNLRDQVEALKRQISNLEAGLNLFINTLNND